MKQCNHKQNLTISLSKTVLDKLAVIQLINIYATEGGRKFRITTLDYVLNQVNPIQTIKTNSTSLIFMFNISLPAWAFHLSSLLQMLVSYSTEPIPHLPYEFY
jgi:hypothetical protein